MKKVTDISGFPEGPEEDAQEQQASVEKLLKLTENDTNLTVDSIECLPGSQQGDNYMSIIKRILVRGKRRSRTAKKSKGKWGMGGVSLQYVLREGADCVVILQPPKGVDLAVGLFRGGIESSFFFLFCQFSTNRFWGSQANIYIFNNLK